MDAEDMGDDGGTAREARFVNLIQPNRDMAANWSVDVGKQLESYLEELKAAGLFDDSDCPLNFAEEQPRASHSLEKNSRHSSRDRSCSEAALLIQGSIQVYSRKVEYLYNLVLRALEFVSEKKQGQEGEKLPSKGVEQDYHRADEEGKDFLKLDDEISEEGDIDVVDGEDSPITRPMKVPSSLLVTEAEGCDMSGEAGELASYNVATCTLYRNFLLLDPVDTVTVDKYLAEQEHRWGERGEATGTAPTNSPLRKNSSTRLEDLRTAHGLGEGGPGAENTSPLSGSPAKGGAPDWQGDKGDEMTWDECHVEDDFPEVPHQDKAAQESPKAGNPEVPIDDYRDPWEPLNPHEEGTLPVNHFKKGPTQRIRRSRKDQSASFLTVRRNGVFFPEFAKALQAREAKAKTGRRGEEHNEAENIKRSCRQNPDERPKEGDPFYPLHEEANWGELGESGNEDNSPSDEFEAADLDASGNTEPSNPFGSPQQHGSPPAVNVSDVTEDASDFEHATAGDNTSLEDLCRAHVDSVLQKLAESRTRSGLTSRVTTWKNKIEAALKEDESRPPFDIHDVGDRLLETLSTVPPVSNEADIVEVDESFAFLVNGESKDGVARSFSALLQLVNNGNVLIDRGPLGSESFCFTVEYPFRVKLLSAQSRHEGLFEHMNPRATVGQSSRSKSSRLQANGVHPGSSQRNRTPRGTVSDRPSSTISHSCRTPGSGVRIRTSATIFVSPCSTRKGSRKRGQSVASRHGAGVVDVENRGLATSEKGFTPVKLTPNRRQSKRKPLQTVQVQ